MRAVPLLYREEASLQVTSGSCTHGWFIQLPDDHMWSQHCITTSLLFPVKSCSFKYLELISQNPWKPAAHMLASLSYRTAGSIHTDSPKSALRACQRQVGDNLADLGDREGIAGRAVESDLCLSHIQNLCCFLCIKRFLIHTAEQSWVDLPPLPGRVSRTYLKKRIATDIDFFILVSTTGASLFSLLHKSATQHAHSNFPPEEPLSFCVETMTVSKEVTAQQKPFYSTLTAFVEIK